MWLRGYAHFHAWARSVHVDTWIKNCRHCHARRQTGLETDWSFERSSARLPVTLLLPTCAKGMPWGKRGSDQSVCKNCPPCLPSLQRFAAQNQTHWSHIDQKTWSLQRKHVRHPGVTQKESHPALKLPLIEFRKSLYQSLILKSRMVLCSKISWK